MTVRRVAVHRIAAAAVVVAAALVSDAAADRVERRGRESVLVGTITGIDDAGVHLRSDLGAAHFVAWDRVRAVDVEPPHPAVVRHRETALDLWRARSRVERGDHVLAEPILERLFETYRGRTHETALIIAEGLLRCRIARGMNAAAVVPALEVARLRRAGVATDRYAVRPPIIDDTTLLVPALPPAWVPGRSLLRLERELDDYLAHDRAQGDPVVAALAASYRRAAAAQLGLPVPALDVSDDAADAEGVRLLEMIGRCLVTGPDAAAERASGRAALDTAWSQLTPWGQDWGRFAMGASLVADDDAEQRQRGIVELLHVPVRSARAVPYLAGLALYVAAESAARDGHAETARVLEAELTRLFPTHPIHRAAGTNE